MAAVISRTVKLPNLRSVLLRDRRDWDLLAEEVVPVLLTALRKAGEARVWTTGRISDAVAVAVAYQHAGGGGPAGLRAFAGRSPSGPGQVAFPRSEIRCVPPAARSAAFRRSEHGWVPEPCVARHVVLGRPAGPVDVVAARSATPEMIDLLNPGGHLVVADPGSPPPGLLPVGSSGRLFRRCGHRRRVPRGPDGLEARISASDEASETLADWQAQFELISSYGNLARSLARRFSGHGEPRQDLDQVALMGLVLAAKRYDTSRGTSFSTFATTTILGELKRYFRDKTWMMKVPRSLQEAYLAVKEAREVLSHELSCSPTIAQVAERVGISEETVLQAMEAGDNYWPESLDAGVRPDDTGRDVPVLDGGFQQAVERQDLARLLPRLAPREQVLLQRLYFDGWTQRQAAEEMGVSQMQVSRVLARTIASLRTWSA